jgi:hypothetical protein
MDGSRPPKKRVFRGARVVAHYRELCVVTKCTIGCSLYWICGGRGEGVLSEKLGAICATDRVLIFDYVHQVHILLCLWYRLTGVIVL